MPETLPSRPGMCHRNNFQPVRLSELPRPFLGHPENRVERVLLLTTQGAAVTSSQAIQGEHRLSVQRVFRPKCGARSNVTMRFFDTPDRRNGGDWTPADMALVLGNVPKLYFDIAGQMVRRGRA